MQPQTSPKQISARDIPEVVKITLDGIEGTSFEPPINVLDSYLEFQQLDLFTLGSDEVRIQTRIGRGYTMHYDKKSDIAMPRDCSDNQGPEHWTTQRVLEYRLRPGDENAVVNDEIEAAKTSS